MYNFRGFTQKANIAVNLGIEIAQSLSHTWVGSEHILLGLLKEGSGVAAAALASENVDFEKVLELTKEKIGSGNNPVRLTINDFTPRAKHVIEMSNAVRAKLATAISVRNIFSLHFSKTKTAMPLHSLKSLVLISTVFQRK